MSWVQENLIAMSFIIEMKMGMSLYTWQTDPVHGTLDFTTPTGYFSEQGSYRALEPYLYKEIVKIDPTFVIPGDVRNSEETKVYCDYLKGKSLEALKKLPPSSPPPEVTVPARKPH